MQPANGRFTQRVYAVTEAPVDDLELATKKYVDDNAGGGGGGVSDGDKGDVVVSGSGTVWTIDTNAVTTTKINNGAVTNAKINDVDVSKVTGFNAAVISALSTTWVNLAITPNSITFNSTIGAGDVWDYVYGPTTYYRLVPSPYDPADDGFYETFSLGVLSDLITTRA